MSHVLIAYVTSTLAVTPLMMTVVFKIQEFKIDDHKKYTICLNLEYVIHCYGEWTMLMLGESILGLLIVDFSKDQGYNITFYAGILSVIFLQNLHFKSQPHHIEEHAMQKSCWRGIGWYTLSNLYSMALIAVGVSYKIFLTEYTDPYYSTIKVEFFTLSAP